MIFALQSQYTKASLLFCNCSRQPAALTAPVLDHRMRYTAHSVLRGRLANYSIPKGMED